jgi:cellulose synthase/poly-beta-1,6-N-acetylglucosamine synthase-like glycosyltransferase
VLLELVVFFALAVTGATLLVVVPGAARAHAVMSAPLGAGLLSAVGWGIAVLENDRVAGIVLGAFAAVAWIATSACTRRWGLLSSLMFAMLVLGSASYIVYAFAQTLAQASGVIGWSASTILLGLEVAALALSTSYLFEVLDVLGRRQRLRRTLPEMAELPWVVLQVPTYSEPLDVVRPTLESLARIDYPRLMVQVVDNNTKDPALWRGLEEMCKQLGSRFQFIHLDPWPGYKAGALNEATRRLPREIEIVGIVDADYVVHPQFLRRMVPHFADPKVAFAQSAQHYRDWEDDSYLRGLFYSFRYFFDVTLPARAHRNAIIFCGTMGLIRRSVLDEIGGWNETCITEDAEASLRMLGAGRGYVGVYDPKPWGAGFMPLSFDGLKKQRFRWALGGIQILRQHWREFVPFARHRLDLRPAQRVHYLLGSVQWFGDLLMACFTLLLVLTAAAIAMHHRLPIRQLTGAVIVVPVLFLVTGVLRTLWAMRRTTGCTWRDSLHALRIWFALSWVVALACLRGLVRPAAAFMRTAKRKDGESTLTLALRSCRTEITLSAAAAMGAIVVAVRAPSPTAAVIAVLLIFMSLFYASAPLASVAAEGIPLTPMRRAYLQSAQSTGDRPGLGRRGAVIGGAAAVAAVAAVAAASALTVNSPSDTAPFSGSSDLPQIGSVGSSPPSPSEQPAPSPSLSAAPSPTAAGASPTPAPGTPGTSPPPVPPTPGPPRPTP